MGGVKGLKDAWLLGVLHVEYERLKKIQEQQRSVTYKVSQTTSMFKSFKR